MRTLWNEKKANWVLHFPSLVFAYNVTPHNITGYQLYKLMFGHKTPTVCDAWLGLASYNNKAITSKCAWLISKNWWALKHIKHSARKSQATAGGKILHILLGNLVLLRDHLEGQNKIQDNFLLSLLIIRTAVFM